MSNLRGSFEEISRPPAGAEVHGWTAEDGGEILLGESVAIRKLRTQVQRVAPYFRTALVRGEAGTGKELVARALHGLSAGAAGPFVTASARMVAEVMTAAATPEAIQAGTMQCIEAAHGGMLYLDGVDELAPAVQAGMLRFLAMCEERAAMPSGEQSGRLDLRIVAATSRDLRMLAAIGQFDQGLYARLSAVEIVVPPLRERVEDIAGLAAWMLHRLTERTGLGLKTLRREATAELERRAWPHNLPELEQVLAQAAMLASGPEIEPSHVAAAVAGAPPCCESKPTVTPKSDRLQDVIDQHVIDVLTRCGGNKLRAAERLGISRSTLYRMLESASTSVSAKSIP